MRGKLIGFQPVLIEDTNEKCQLKLEKNGENSFKCVLIDSHNSRYTGYGKTNILAINDCISNKKKYDRINYVR